MTEWTTSGFGIHECRKKDTWMVIGRVLPSISGEFTAECINAEGRISLEPMTTLDEAKTYVESNTVGAHPKYYPYLYPSRRLLEQAAS